MKHVAIGALCAYLMLSLIVEVGGSVALRLTIAGLLLIYFVVELGWGGGDQNDPHHNRPPWSMW